MYIGNRASSRMLSAVRRLCGHDSAGPTGVRAQSKPRVSTPISPPPLIAVPGAAVIEDSFASSFLEDALRHHHVHADVAIHELCDAEIGGDAGEAIGVHLAEAARAGEVVH